MTRRAAGFLFGAAVALAACGDDGTGPPPESRELVSYSRIGGFAYTEERLVVDRDGSAVLAYNEGPEQLETRFELGPGELAGLEQAVEAARGAVAPKPSSECADCFVYAVEAEGVSLRLDDASFTSTELPPVVSGLVQRIGEIARLARERA